MKRAWWKEAVVYQVYPRSFMDSNGDGIGDLRGVISRLDYIRALGADVIWLNPIYRSPNDDNGYDISDYRDIMDEFGTMADFDELLSEAHARGLRILMDLVVNHSSDEHAWFAESRKSRDNRYRNYYIWRPDDGKGYPNNWGSAFSGSAWKKDEVSGDYYLHLFSAKQPDLNWENVEVRKSVYDIMRFWLDKGVDGFRMDVINFLSKVPGLPDGPKAPDEIYGDFTPYTVNGPKIHEYLKEMNREVLSCYDVMTVGETPNVTTDDAKRYTGEDEHELNMIFQFAHMSLDYGSLGKWSLNRVKLDDLRTCLSHWQTCMNGCGWNSLYWNNHDQPRVVSRFGNDSSEENRVVSAKMLGTLLHMMQGTPYIYQGEELGMTNVPFERIQDYRDIEILNAWQELVVNGTVDSQDMIRFIQAKGRDNARTPMQWDDSLHAGFTSGTPWIAVNPNYSTINAKAQESDPDSVLNYYRKLIRLRRENPVIVYGDFRLLLPEDPQLFAYERRLEDTRLLVLCNFSSKSYGPIKLASMGWENAILLISNISTEEADDILFQPYEARVYKLG